ncbi:MAG TPA: hypothetical protein DCR74_12875 [Achromobacter sp.]|nr:hypothetical protein [Achromobacter sp.]
MRSRPSGRCIGLVHVGAGAHHRGSWRRRTDFKDLPRGLVFGINQSDDQAVRIGRSSQGERHDLRHRFIDRFVLGGGHPFATLALVGAVASVRMKQAELFAVASYIFVSKSLIIRKRVHPKLHFDHTCQIWLTVLRRTSHRVVDDPNHVGNSHRACRRLLNILPNSVFDIRR